MSLFWFYRFLSLSKISEKANPEIWEKLVTNVRMDERTNKQEVIGSEQSREKYMYKRFIAHRKF